MFEYLLSSDREFCKMVGLVKMNVKIGRGWQEVIYGFELRGGIQLTLCTGLHGVHTLQLPRPCLGIRVTREDEVFLLEADGREKRIVLGTPFHLSLREGGVILDVNQYLLPSREGIEIPGRLRSEGNESMPGC